MQKKQNLAPMRSYIVGLMGLSLIAACNKKVESQQPDNVPAYNTAKITENALLGSVTRKAKRGYAEVEILEHHKATNTAQETLCGSYRIEGQEDPRPTYFIVSTTEFSVVDPTTSTRWAKFC